MPPDTWRRRAPRVVIEHEPDPPPGPQPAGRRELDGAETPRPGSRALRVALALLLLLALLGAAGLWIGPRLVDWEPWRVRLATLAGLSLDRPVTLEGPITLSLLPQPRVEAASVTIGPAEDGVTVTARAMRLRLDLGALLAGRLEPREMTIVGGEIRLPWPPAELPSFRPPAWLTALDARLEDCRLLIGDGLVLEGLNARLVTGGATEALVAEGQFAWRGHAVRFSGQLGRAGDDGVAPLDLGMAVAGATLTARGVLSPGGGFEGRMEAAGPDLSALLPAPAGAFRASGRLTATADLLAADDLALELGGQAARGAITLRLAPAARLDIALAAGRLDLDAWVVALRGARGQAVPVSIDLSAEATAYGPVPLRRLRGGFFLEGDRLTLSDVSALLPGETEIEVTGATAGPRIELGIRFAGENLRDTLAALGMPLAWTDPVRLRAGEGRFRLALGEGGQAEIADLAATVDGTRISGAGVLRPGGARPSVGLGLTLDRLELDGLLPREPDWPALAGRLDGFDLNLRLAVEGRLAWRGGFEAERLTLDATLENARLALRRLALRLGELDIAASGAAVLGATPRMPDLNLEASGASGTALLPLLPSGWSAALAPLLTGQPVALRLAGSGPPEAVALRAEGDLGDLRLEAAATLDAPAGRGTGTATLRHPGAPRLLGPLLGRGVAEWLGPGSFAAIANLSCSIGGGGGVAAEYLDVVAGGLRVRGQLGLALGGARPRLTGRLAAERLPLPADLAPGPMEPLGFGRLAALDAELALEAGVVEPPAGPALESVGTTLRLDAGTLRLEGMRARLGGGTLAGALLLEGAASPPRLALEAQAAEVALAERLFGLPLDLGTGRFDGTARVQAEGHSRAALTATLGGALELRGRDGVLVGYDLAAVQAAAALPDLAEAERVLREALAGGGNGGGATAFERLEMAAQIAEGRVRLGEAKLASEGGGAGASASGEVDLGRGVLDLRLATRPLTEAPEIGLRLTGPAAAPQRVPELVPFLLWRAER